MQGTQEHVDHVEDSASLAGFDDILEALAYIIHKISCEVYFETWVKIFSTFIIFHSCAILLLIKNAFHTNSLINSSTEAKQILSLPLFLWEKVLLYKKRVVLWGAYIAHFFAIDNRQKHVYTKHLPFMTSAI